MNTMQLTTRQDPVIYIIDGSTALTGAFVSARNIAHALEGKASIVLVIPDNSDIGLDALRDLSAVQKLPIRHLRRSFRAVLTYFPYLLVSSFLLWRRMRKDGASVLVVNDFYLMQGFAARLLGFQGQIVTWVRMKPASLGRVSGFMLWATKKASDNVVAVSRYIESLLPGGIATNLLYDSVDPQFETKVPDQLQVDRTFVFLGNYIPGKGQDIAIEALAQVISEFPSARIEFYGGDMGLAKNRLFRNSLEQRTKALGLADHVLFGNFAADPRAVLMGKYAAINLSRSESFSRTVLEASACGLAVIASRSGGPEEIVEHGKTGFLIPVDDVRGCAEAMLDLCRNPTLASRMGREGRIRVLSEFSRAAFQRDLVRLLHLQ